MRGGTGGPVSPSKHFKTTEHNQGACVMTLLEIGSKRAARRKYLPSSRGAADFACAAPRGRKSIGGARKRQTHCREHPPVPHPYKRSDADDFISAVNVPGPDGEVAFLITLRDGPVIGACGIAMQDGAPDVGYWVGVRSGARVTRREPRAAVSVRFHRARPRVRSRPARASPIRRRGGFWKSAASSGPASASAASARSTRRRRSTASASTAGCGSRSKAGAR